MNNVYIVTGGNGYIGSHMCKLLHDQGSEVHIIDNHSTSPKTKTHDYGIFHNFDIDDKEKVKSLLSKVKPSGVFHFAARALVSESQLNPFLYYLENTHKTTSLLQSCVESNVKNFIFSSTCATFGISNDNAIDENHPQVPINTYGLTKMMIENILKDLCSKKMINAVVFRYFNASGCSPDGDLGENHEPETHLIPNICKSIINNKFEGFTLYGNDYDTPDGSCIRDYIHVMDLAKAHLSGLNFLRANSGYYDFNLSSEKGHSVLEVIKTFEEITSKKVNIILKKRRPGDPPILIGSSLKAKQLLDFKCEYNLKDSIQHTYNYFTGQKP